MKTLYLSDVDGTLTVGDNHLSVETRALLGQVVERKLPLALATGRSLNGIHDLTELLGHGLPAVVLNGALIYDLSQDRALATWAIPTPQAQQLCRLFEEAGMPFTTNIFLPDEQRCKVYFNYDKSYPWPMRAKNRTNGLLHDYRIRCHDSVLPHMAEGECLYIGCDASYEAVLPIYQQVQQLPGVRGFFHQSAYRPGVWFLDIVAADSGKGTAARWLKEHFAAQELVTFGDNRNDIPMLQAGDRSYAMAWAPKEVQEAATAVLPDDPNSVLRFLLEDAR